MNPNNTGTPPRRDNTPPGFSFALSCWCCGVGVRCGRSVGVLRRFCLWACWVYPGGIPGILWAVCAAVGVALRRRPTFLPKKDFLTDFFKESETEHHPGEVLRFVCKLSTSSQQNGHHQRHTIHQPQQAPTDNTSEDTAARSSAELPTPRKQAILLHIFKRIFQISPG